MHITLRVVAVAHKGMSARSGVARRTIIHRSAGIKLALYQFQPLAAAVISTFAHHCRTVVSEIIAQSTRHKHRQCTAAFRQIVHFHGYAEVCRKCRRGICLTWRRTRFGVERQHVVPVVHRAAEVGCQLLTVPCVALVPRAALRIIMVFHYLCRRRCHASHVVVLCGAARCVCGALLIERIVLSPVYISQQRIHYHGALSRRAGGLRGACPGAVLHIYFVQL